MLKRLGWGLRRGLLVPIGIEPLGPDTGNEILNGGFEEPGAGGVDIWADWTETVSDGVLTNEVVIVHSGNDSCKMTAGPTVDTRVNQFFAVTPLTIHRLIFWTQGDGVNDGFFHVWDATNGANIIALTNTGITGAAWAPYAVEFVIPAGCISVNFFLRCPNVNGGICYFDDVDIRAVT